MLCVFQRETKSSFFCYCLKRMAPIPGSTITLSLCLSVRMLPPQIPITPFLLLPLPLLSVFMFFSSLDSIYGEKIRGIQLSFVVIVSDTDTHTQSVPHIHTWTWVSIVSYYVINKMNSYLGIWQMVLFFELFRALCSIKFMSQLIMASHNLKRKLNLSMKWMNAWQDLFLSHLVRFFQSWLLLICM